MTHTNRSSTYAVMGHLGGYDRVNWANSPLQTRWIASVLLVVRQSLEIGECHADVVDYQKRLKTEGGGRWGLNQGA